MNSTVSYPAPQPAALMGASYHTASWAPLHPMQLGPQYICEQKHPTDTTRKQRQILGMLTGPIEASLA